jgi:hypothetical protein
LGAAGFGVVVPPPVPSVGGRAGSSIAGFFLPAGFFLTTGVLLEFTGVILSPTDGGPVRGSPAATLSESRKIFDGFAGDMLGLVFGLTVLTTPALELPAATLSESRKIFDGFAGDMMGVLFGAAAAGFGAAAAGFGAAAAGFGAVAAGFGLAAATLAESRKILDGFAGDMLGMVLRFGIAITSFSAS